MHNFASDVDGGAKGLQSDLDNVDGAHNTGAEAARLEQQDPLLTGGRPGEATVRDGVEDSCGHFASIPMGGPKR